MGGWVSVETWRGVVQVFQKASGSVFLFAVKLHRWTNSPGASNSPRCHHPTSTLIRRLGPALPRTMRERLAEMRTVLPPLAALSQTMPWVLSPKQIWRRTAKTCSENPLAVLNFEWWICQCSLVGQSTFIFDGFGQWKTRYTSPFRWSVSLVISWYHLRIFIKKFVHWSLRSLKLSAKDSHSQVLPNILKHH